MKSRRFSLDSSVLMGVNGPVSCSASPASQKSSKSRRSSEGRKTHSLEDGQVDPLRSSLRLPHAIEEEGLDRPDGVVCKLRFLKYNKTFHKLFQNLPKDEDVTHAFTCALQKEVLYHGRLFVSKNYVCFHSSVLLKETNVVVHAPSIQEVKKQRSALSKLSIRTSDGDKYSFVSLRNREVCYNVLQSLCPHIEGHVESTNSSPHMSSAENGPDGDADVVSSHSSLEDSLEHQQARDTRDYTDLGVHDRGSSTPRSSISREHDEPFTDEEEKGASWGRSTQMKSFFRRQISNQNTVMCVYLLLLMVVLFSSGYLCLRIVALEEQLSSLGALPELHQSEFKET